MVNSLIRRGLYALPVSGVLTALPWLRLLSGPAKLQTDPQGYARWLVSASHLIGGYIYLGGVICLLFGVLALYGYLATSRAARIATAGMVASVIAIALLLPVFGVVVLAESVLGDVYLAGHTDIIEAMRQLSGGTFSNRIVAYFTVFLLVGLLAAVATGAAVWQSKRLPKWAGVVTAVGLVLSLSVTPVIAWVGALCLIAGGISLAQAARPSPATSDSSIDTALRKASLAS